MLCRRVDHPHRGSRHAVRVATERASPLTNHGVRPLDSTLQWQAREDLRVQPHDRATAAECYALRAAEYGRFYRNIPADRFVDDLDTASTGDGQAASTLMAVVESGAVVGTCRLTLARHPRFRDVRSEVAELADFAWADLASRVGVPESELVVGELGKFAVSRASDVRRVKWRLLTATGAAAVTRGMHAVVALMPPLVERAARHAGVVFRPYPSARLRRDSPAALSQILRYPDYFLPGLRRAANGVDTSGLETLPVAELRRLLDGVPDGPRLWWITPTELAQSSDPSANA